MSARRIEKAPVDWAELVRVALLGTQREPVPSLPVQSALGGLGEQLDTTSPERTLLTLAGAGFLYERAGEQPQRLTGQSASPRLPAQDANRLLSLESMRYLRILADGTLGDLLPEFLDRMVAHGLFVPPQLLPDLLDRGMKVARHRAKVLPVLDAHGQWLASQHVKWQYAAPITRDWNALLEAWRTGKTPARQALLRKLRTHDAKLGRELMESVWGSISEKGRTWYVKLLEVNLSMDDEPFLERLLNDRNSAVRKKAAEFLALLPASRLCQRMTANCRDVLLWRPRSRKKIVLNFPDELSAELIRDGVTDRKHGKMAHLREAQLRHMIGAVPLEVWTEQWGVSAEQIVQTFGATGWTRTFTAGFTLATKRQKNPEWAQAFISLHKVTAQTLPLVALLSDTEFEALLESLVEASKRRTNDKDDPLLRLVTHWPRQFTPKMTDLYLETLLRYIERSERVASLSPMMNRLTKKLAQLMPIDSAEHVAVVLNVPDASAHWQAAIRNMVTTLRMRQNMLAALDADAARLTSS